MPAGLLWDLTVRDHASPGFLRVAGAADKAAASTERASLAMSKSVARMGQVGATLTKSLTLPLVGLAAVSIDQAAKYQKSLATIANATDQTSKQMQSAQSGLLKIATQTGTGLSQLSEGLYTVEKGGLRGTKALLTVKAAAEGAKAENADLGVVTNALTSIMASYGSKIGTPVQAMNMLIRGSGLAKTSLQDFAGSLSTVVPLAAKAGIGFDQVAGAIDTLTQHGTSAQEATQELAFLIRGLQAPSQVAQKAMQQVGLSVTNVTRNLGKRGLIGTLAEVENAVSTHLGKSGLVVVDTFKKSQSASADLQTMLKSMPKGLADVSKGLLSGSVSIKSYQADAKALGGQAGAGALQFLSLYKSSKGFNDLLKSGQPAQRTAAAQLKDMLGGASGLNAALQLGGHSAKYFSDASTSVANAAKGAGADVLGWSRTQGLFSTKVDQAKANLQVMAVEIGTALLPAMSKVADGVGKAVGWFSKLSGSGKSVVLWTVGILAALGPVLSIGAKLTTVGASMARFASTAGSKIATLAGASESTAAKVGTAMRRVTSAVVGVGVGIAASQIGSARTSGGWLTSIFLGTAGGWALGGPIGAAVGGVTAAIGKGLQLWSNHKDAAKAAIAAEKQDIASLTDAINTDNGALGTNYRLLVARRLQKSGALDIAQGLHIDLGLLAGAAGGNKGQQKSLTNLLTGRQGNTIQGGLSILRNAGVADPNSALAGVIGGNKDILSNLVNARGTSVSLTKSQRDAILADAGQVNSLRKLASALGLVINETSAAQKSANQLAHYMNAGRTATGGFAHELSQFKHGTTEAVDANGQLTTSLARSTVVGQHNRATISELAASAQNDAEKTLQSALAHGKTLPQALAAADSKLKTNIGNIKSSTSAAGFNSSAVQTLIGKYGNIPKSVITYVRKHGVLPPDIQAITDALNRIPRSVDVGIIVTASTRGSLASTYASQVPRFKIATGGSITGAGTGTSDSIPAMLSNGEHVLTASDVHKAGGQGAVYRMRRLIQAGALRFAQGGGVESAFARLLASLGVGRAGQAGALGNGQAESNFRTNASNASGHIGVFQWGGGRADALRRLAGRLGTRWDTEKAQLAYFRQELEGPYRSVLNGLRHASSARAAATLFNNQFEVSGDTRGVRENNAARIFQQLASGQIKSTGGSTSRVPSVASLRAMASLITRIKGTDVQRIMSNLGKTVADTKSGFASLFNDLARAGAPNALVKTLKGIEGQIVSIQTKAIAAKSKLSAMTQYRSGITSTLTGAFDPTKYGSVTDLISGLHGATGSNNAYAHDVNKLRREAKGNRSLLGFINTLAASGQTATLHTLATGSRGQLSQVTKAVTGYNASVAAGGDAATAAKYGTSVAAQQHLVNTLVGREDKWAAIVGKLVHSMGHQKVTLKVGTREIAAEVVNSHEMQHLLAELEHELSKGKS